LPEIVGVKVSENPEVIDNPRFLQETGIFLLALLHAANPVEVWEIARGYIYGDNFRNLVGVQAFDAIDEARNVSRRRLDNELIFRLVVYVPLPAVYRIGKKFTPAANSAVTMAFAISSALAKLFVVTKTIEHCDITST
jgi:hypothetical protein